MANISTLKKAHEVLGKLGYESYLNESSVAVKVGGSDHPFTAVITHSEASNHFQITCLIMHLGKIKKETLFKFSLAALDANSRIAPFAYALLTDHDNPEEDDERKWPVVLIHSIPLGDFSKQELSSAMRSLMMALLDSASTISILAE